MYHNVAMYVPILSLFRFFLTKPYVNVDSITLYPNLTEQYLHLLNMMFFHNRCLEYLCRYGSCAGMDTRDNTYKTPLLVAVEAQLPGHLKRLLMAKVRKIQGWYIIDER